MTVGKTIDHFIEEYFKAKEDVWIRKPISYALYRTWEWCDKEEKERLDPLGIGE